MTTYNTGNPIGSTDARDLYDNAQNLDNFANGTAASYTDRRGVSRRSLAGIDATADLVLSGLGYAPPVAYAAGISLTLTTQTIEYAGEVYAPKVANLPFTTSGTFETAKFRLIQGVASADLSSGGGAAMVGYTPAGTGAVATTVQSKLRETVSVFDFMTDEQIASVRAGTSTNDTAAIQAAITAAIAASGSVVFPAGTYTINSAINLKGKYVSLIGAGETLTTIKAGASLTNMFDAEESSDVQISPFVIQGMTIDGNNTTNNGINIRYRHMFKLLDLVVQNCTNGIKEKDTWLGYHENVRSQVNGTSWWLVGANHSSGYYRCSAIGFSTYGFKIEGLGTALDGNEGLLFSACDVEFAAGVGVYFDGTEANFDSCYLGEIVEGAVFDVRGGKLNISKGIFFFGHTANTYAFLLAGGNVTVQGTKIASQGALGVSGLASSTGGKIKFVDVQTGLIVGGDPVFTGDPLDYGPAARTFVSRYGKNFTNGTYNNTVTATTSGNSKTFEVATVTGSPSILYMNAPLVDKAEWQDGQYGYFVIVYSSNAPFTARLQGGALGAAPLKPLASLPSTGGMTKTAIKVDFTLDSAAYTILELYNDTASVGTSITIHEVFFADRSFINPTAPGDLNNIYKC